MESRQDALWGASEFVLALREIAFASHGEAVATAGRVEVEPGATNVVPGVARVRVELRGINQLSLAGPRDAAAAQYGLAVRLDPWDTMPATPLDAGLVDIALAAAARGGVRAIRMPSWAGHDVKILAPHVPAALLFVPSRGGVSHAPDEYTELAQLARGAQLLLDTIREADQYLSNH